MVSDNIHVKKTNRIKLLIIVLLIITPYLLFSQTSNNNRLIVITDIGNEPDDTQSLIRLLLYSNQIDIEGLIASTSYHQKNNVYPDIIHKIIDKYEKVCPNLLKHEANFPSSKKLSALVKQGLPVYGMEGVGDGKDSEGSEWIIKILEKDDDRPLWISVWGGTNVLAQAMWKIKENRSEDEAKRLIKKMRIYAISDQDNTATWIRKNFKDLFYISSPGNYSDATWSAINKIFPNANNEVISNSWLTTNIQQGHGPLGAIYPDVAYGMEGDTPSWLMLIPNGLNEPEYPNWGGWGGRYELYIPDFDPKKKWSVPIEKETRPFWTNAEDKYTPRVNAQWGRSIVKDTVVCISNHVTLWRWREEIQNDFAARMSWCNKNYEEANHHPIVKLNTPERFTIKSGEYFNLDAGDSYDPDGDNLSFFWFQYAEAGTYKRNISFSPENVSGASPIRAPKVEEKETVHFIVKVTDKGIPKLTRYKRVIVTIEPK